MVDEGKERNPSAAEIAAIIHRRKQTLVAKEEGRGEDVAIFPDDLQPLRQAVMRGPDDGR